MNYEVLNLKLFFIVSSVSGVWVDSVANFGFLSKTMNKKTSLNAVIGRGRLILLYPNVRNNIGGNIPIDVPQPKYWRGCVPGGVDAMQCFFTFGCWLNSVRNMTTLLDSGGLQPPHSPLARTPMLILEMVMQTELDQLQPETVSSPDLHVCMCV